MFPVDFQFSQSSLQDAAECARRFWLRHVVRLRYPAPLATPLHTVEAHQQRGDRFHRAVHQALTGVPPTLLADSLADDDLLATWWEHWQAAGLDNLPPAHQPEVAYTVPAPGKHPAGLRVIARYDLIARDPGGTTDPQVMIVDWKTSDHLPAAARLETRWQTVVYRWVLATATPGIPPRRITMRYWFAAHPAHPVDLPYSATAYAADTERLTAMIDALSGAAAAVAAGHQPAEAAFPKTDDLTRCAFCNYRTLCGRDPRPGDAAALADADLPVQAGDLLIALDQVAEVAF